jgi:hypothetical protein
MKLIQKSEIKKDKEYIVLTIKKNKRQFFDDLEVYGQGMGYYRSKGNYYLQAFKEYFTDKPCYINTIPGEFLLKNSKPVRRKNPEGKGLVISKNLTEPLDWSRMLVVCDEEFFKKMRDELSELGKNEQNRAYESYSKTWERTVLAESFRKGDLLYDGSLNKSVARPIKRQFRKDRKLIGKVIFQNWLKGQSGGIR